MTLPFHLRAARERRNLTQQQAAQRADISPIQISHWETGRKIPDLSSLVALADAYECSLDQLIGRSHRA